MERLVNVFMKVFIDVTSLLRTDGRYITNNCTPATLRKNQQHVSANEYNHYTTPVRNVYKWSRLQCQHCTFPLSAAEYILVILRIIFDE